MKWFKTQIVDLILLLLPFVVVIDVNKPIWMHAEEIEVNKVSYFLVQYYELA